MLPGGERGWQQAMHGAFGAAWRGRAEFLWAGLSGSVRNLSPRETLAVWDSQINTGRCGGAD